MIDKIEAAKRLEVSVRTLMTMVASNQIAGAYKVVGRKRRLMFDENEVERLRIERAGGIHMGALVEAVSKSMTPLDAAEKQFTPSSAPFFQALGQWHELNEIASLEKKLVLTIDEASIYSGLGKGFIKQAIEGGKLSAFKGAGHRASTVIRRGELERFVENLGTGKRRA